MAWIITKDHLCEKGISPGRVGFRSLKWDELASKNTPTFRFRMLDDDGEVYYEGKSTNDSSFAPLDNLGTPDAGCTEIQYWNKEKKVWETL
jgi:hypothetical protein